MSKVLPSRLNEALVVLGTRLAEEGLSYDLVAVGAWAMAEMNLITRPTEDIDLLGHLSGGEIEEVVVWPRRLREIVREVGEAFGLVSDWINTGPTFLLVVGLPAGFESRLKPHEYGSLTLWLPARIDQIFLKTYAAADQPGTHHGGDLRALNPTRDERRDAAMWASQHDGPKDFQERLRKFVDDPEAL